eukprot:TRINITY_DN8793_c0_g1_i3.p1 TRINITY_DN8793_c0_g1~~TRINITY_DN8793_c0_g1_i3.p1  ORF type:complete len:226 (-),score=60.73 TRINITY_DN8793_c0_g1_i3:77-754(-)
MIRLWETKSWKEKQKLVSHKLTVTQLEFSHDDRFLLSASRDRTVSLFELVGEEYQLVWKNLAHERIVWSCSWSHDDLLFATGSRDKVVKIWSQVKEGGKLVVTNVATLTLPDAVTSVSFAPWSHPPSTNQNQTKSNYTPYLLAIGQENGQIALYSNHSEVDWAPLCTFDKKNTHVESVTRLRWQFEGSKGPIEKEDEKNKSKKGKFLLASCSSDFSFRLFSIHFN